MKKEDLTLAYKPVLVERRHIFSLGFESSAQGRQGAVPAPVGFDFTPRCSVDEKKKPGGRQKERVRRLLFDKAN